MLKLENQLPQASLSSRLSREEPASYRSNDSIERAAEFHRDLLDNAFVPTHEQILSNLGLEALEPSQELKAFTNDFVKVDNEIKNRNGLV